MSRSDPQLAPLVPEVFRSNAWRALGAAEAAVAADPVDPAASSALGLAALNAGHDAGAAAAFRVSGALGWRDLPTQIYWLSAAAVAGDYPVAAERADALLRQNAALLEQPQLLVGLENAPAGRRALAARLAGRPKWFSEYWNRTFTLPPDRLEARARVLDEPALRAARIGCAEVRGLAVRLSEVSRTARSRAILERFCAGPDGGLLLDGGFERSRLDAAAPSGWQFAGAGGLDLRLSPTASGSGNAAVVASTLPYRIVFASQALQLAPGRYRISWRAQDSVGAASRRIAVRLACSAGAGPFVSATPAGGDRFAGNVEVTKDCPAQTLELAILPGAGPVTVDDFALAPV